MSQFNDCLIIDDDRDIVDVLTMYCENMGLFRNILVSRDGVDASKKLHNQTFSLILLDINMPKKTGLDLLNEFDDLNPNSLENVVIVSGELGKDELAFSLKHGVKNFVVKPFDEATFQAKILSVMKKILEIEAEKKKKKQN